MLIFLEARLALLAVPKTGSTSLQSALWAHADVAVRAPPALNHMNRTWFESSWKKLLAEQDIASFETVAVVREPIDWLSSWYRYRRRPAIRHRATSTSQLSFSDFVEAWLRAPPPEVARVGRQSWFCARSDGAFGIDHVFPYENLAALQSFLETRLDVSLEIPRRNRSPEASTELSVALRDRLKSEAPEEFELHSQAARSCAQTGSAASATRRPSESVTL